METAPQPLYKNNALRIAGILLATGLLASCAMPETDAEKKERIEATCSPDEAHVTPTIANVAQVKDNRTGEILACQYLMDARIPYNRPAKLFSLSSETYDSQEFTMESNMGGWMFVGIGELGESSKAKGETVRKRVNLIRVIDEDDNLQTMLLDGEKVKLSPCPDDCEPTVEIKITNEALWEKEEDDDSSIWYSNFDDDGYDGDRQKVVKAIGLYLGDKDNYPPDEDPIYGSPRKPGEVVSTLASEIIISLPAEDIK